MESDMMKKLKKENAALKEENQRLKERLQKETAARHRAGRKPSYRLDEEGKQCYLLHQEGYSLSKVAELLGISRATCYRLYKAYTERRNYGNDS